MVNKMSSTDRERRNKGGSGVNDPSSWQVHLRKPCYDFSVLRVVNDKVQATSRRQVLELTTPTQQDFTGPFNRQERRAVCTNGWT